MSGSYAKHTAIRPAVDDKKRDVDIIVVTNYNKNDDSSKVLSELEEILRGNNNYSNTTIQHHSVGVKMGEISVDIVPVIIEESDDSLYLVGDSETGAWTLTDPKGHKEWSTAVNQNNNQKYKPLVKVFKWWRKTNCPENSKYPKGITLEKIVADNLGDSSLTTEELLIDTIENIIDSYKEDYIDKWELPVIDDPSEKIVGNDLLSGYNISDFSDFIDKLIEHIKLLNDEGTDCETWRKIFGNEFPKDDASKNNRLAVLNSFSILPHKQKPYWRIKKEGYAFITLKVYASDGKKIDYSNNGTPLPKHCDLDFSVITNIKKPFRIAWQIVNTGEEASRENALRGGFEYADQNGIKWSEQTLYKGSHSVQCFVIRNGVCVANSKEIIINIQ